MDCSGCFPPCHKYLFALNINNIQVGKPILREYHLVIAVRPAGGLPIQIPIERANAMIEKHFHHTREVVLGAIHQARDYPQV
jgi:hypothetical protein